MIVSELIEKLRALPADMPVYRDVEGFMRVVTGPRIARLHTWSVGGSISEDYMPETMLDDDEAKFTGVILE
jgi:hypothetical protein